MTAGSLFSNVVTSERELRELVGVPGPIAVAKQIDVLDQDCRTFIAHSPYVLLGTSDAAGRCDVSPKGDAPGFVAVLDDRHLAIPDRPGNKRLDGMRNILSNPHVGLLFLVPGRQDTLRVNGRACLVRDEALLERFAVQGKRPLLALGVAVEEVFLHCGKASWRSRLWEPSQWPDVAAMPSPGCVLFAHAKPSGMTTADMDQRFVADKERLY
jgi:PPOX class probable FMN-dependent enzyme